MKNYTRIFGFAILFFSLNIQANVAKPFGIEIGKTKKQDIGKIFKNNLIELPGKQENMNMSLITILEFKKYGIDSIMLGTSSSSGTIDYLMIFIEKELVPELAKILESKYIKIFVNKDESLLGQYITDNSVVMISNKFPIIGIPLLVYMTPKLLEKSMNKMSNESLEDTVVKNLKR